MVDPSSQPRPSRRHPCPYERVHCCPQSRQFCARGALCYDACMHGSSSGPGHSDQLTQTLTPAPTPLHVVINGWFVGRADAGSGQYTDHLLAHLPVADSQARWTVLLPHDPAAEPGADPSASLPKHPNLHVHPVPLPQLPKNLAKLWWEQVTVPRLARQLGADLLWVPYWAGPWWQPVPTVVTIHDLIPLLLPAYRGGLLNRLYTRLVSATARRADRVLTVSQASARDITAHLGIPMQRIGAVHHGPNQPLARVDADLDTGMDETQVRAKYGLPERYFLYLGGFDVRKNLAGILAAYARFRERGGDPAIGLVIAGKLPDVHTKFAPDPRRMAADLGLVEHITFTGWIDEADKPALYALSLGYLFPSHYEGFGMMVLEAMQAGTPVITSR